MFLRKNVHRVVEHTHVVETTLLSTLSLIMNDTRVREIIIFVAAFNNAVRQVNIFPVHKEILIKQAHFIQCFFTAEHTGPAQNLHFRIFVVGQVTHVIPVKSR